MGAGPRCRVPPRPCPHGAAPRAGPGRPTTPRTSSRRDSNPWPLPYQGSALPAELREPTSLVPAIPVAVHTPTGNRTPVFWLRTRCPRPLDDGGLYVLRSSAPLRIAAHTSGGARTPNPRFWRPVLYQLSYGRPCLPSWRRRRPVPTCRRIPWPGAESNCRHHDFQSCALPTELPGLTHSAVLPVAKLRHQPTKFRAPAGPPKEKPARRRRRGLAGSDRTRRKRQTKPASPGVEESASVARRAPRYDRVRVFVRRGLCMSGTPMDARAAVRRSVIAGAGFEPATSGL